MHRLLCALQHELKITRLYIKTRAWYVSIFIYKYVFNIMDIMIKRDVKGSALKLCRV